MPSHDAAAKARREANQLSVRQQAALKRIQLAEADADYHDSQARAARAKAATLRRTWEIPNA